MAGKKIKETEVAKEVKSATSIRKCTCRNDFQDARYGSGNRVHNTMGNGKKRCTVCANVKD